MDGSFTFVGFHVNDDGDLIDPGREETIETKAMTTALIKDLRRNEVALDENYLIWSRNEKIEKLAAVMNLTVGEDLLNVDPTYVLTVDNLMKILAIHMRFRFAHLW